MANHKSVELGWILLTPGYDDFLDWELLDKKLGEADPEGKEADEFIIPDTQDHPEGASPNHLSVETHPCDTNRVFVSWCDLDEEHGWDQLYEPETLGQLVRDYFKTRCPDVKIEIKWGVILTER